MLKVENLRKEYDTVIAVDGVSFTVQRGEVFGLLGPNGAGKTTTIRTVLNIIKPDVGEIAFDGKPFSPETWNTIGYLPEERGLYRKSRILNTILYFASLKGVNARDAKPKALRWLDRFGLNNRAQDKVEELSKGNQQKVQLIASLLHSPQLLILDEPFAGLDPVNQVLLKDVLMELRQSNIAIIFSTHQMEQVEKMCDNIYLINKGKPVLQGALREIKKKYGKNSVHLEFEGDGGFLKNLQGVRRADVYQNYAELELNDLGRTGELLRQCDGKLALRKFEIVEPSLNSIFIDVVGVPQELVHERAAVSLSEKTQKASLDPRLKRSLFSLVITGGAGLVLTIMNLQKDNPDWSLVAVLFGAVILGGVGYFRTKIKIEDEKRKGGQS